MRLCSQLPPAPSALDPELAFFARCLTLLAEGDVPFLVGGAYALKHHAAIVRDTKDLDLFLRESDVPRALSVLASAGYRAELTFPHWLAKAYRGDCFIDLIFNSGNGLTRVDDAWFANASEAMLLGLRVAVCPAEETIWSKAYVMERERYDGADVAHLLKGCARTLDWPRLLSRFGEHWRVLLSHLVLFGYVYPDEADAIPEWVMGELFAKLDGDRPIRTDVCRGTNLSREQYLVDLESGRLDGRLAPGGTMSPDDIATWTAAIPSRT